MAFGRNHLQLVLHELQTALSENADLQRTVDQQTADIFNLQQELSVKSPDVPTELSAITHALRGYVPTLPSAPGFTLLTKATDAISYAQGLNMLLQHARQVGAHEVRKRA